MKRDEHSAYTPLWRWQQLCVRVVCSMCDHLSRHLRSVRLLQRDDSCRRRRLHADFSHALRDRQRSGQPFAGTARPRRPEPGRHRLVVVGGGAPLGGPRQRQLHGPPSTVVRPGRARRHQALSMAQYFIRLRLQRRSASILYFNERCSILILYTACLLSALLGHYTNWGWRDATQRDGCPGKRTEYLLLQCVTWVNASKNVSNVAKLRLWRHKQTGCTA